RVGCPTFDCLIHLVKWNPIFQLTGKRPQHQVQYKLECFLLQYGSCGTDPLQAAHKLMIEFGMMFLYCQRVVQALWELGVHIVLWGDDECRQETFEYIMDVYGFLDCIGMLYGTLIHLTQMPDDNAFSFICCKK
ncbi:hypothetical protein BDR06DRAFT_838693, partial [Suillus hirtellus]